MDVRELGAPEDYRPTPSIRYRVMQIEPEPDGEQWKVDSREVTWDEHGHEIGTEAHEQVLTTKWLEQTKLIWRAQGFIPVARTQLAQAEILFFENRDDQLRLEAQTSTLLPEWLEVWISPTRKQAFRCQVPPTFGFNLRSDEELARQGIGHTELQVSERRGSITAKVYWMNGQPSAEAEARWQPIIERKVREYLQKSIRPQKLSSFMNGGMIEESLRLGDDVRDLIMAGVDRPAMMARLKAKNYQPMDDE